MTQKLAQEQFLVFFHRLFSIINRKLEAGSWLNSAKKC
jgi:hypothetical protein